MSMFKKRNVKGGGAAVRKKEENSVIAEEEEVDTGVNLADKLLEQSLRKRQNGVKSESLAKAGQKSETVAQVAVGSIKIIEGVSKPNSNTQYEKLMEKYVEDKMKEILPDSLTASNGDVNLDSKLVGSKSLLLSSLLESKDKKDAKSQGQEQQFVGLGVGLDEIILPKSYKLDNEYETNVAARKRRDFCRIGQSKGSSAAITSAGDQFISPYRAMSTAKHGSRFAFSVPSTENSLKDQSEGSALAVAAAGSVRSSSIDASTSSMPTVARPTDFASVRADPNQMRNIYVDPTIKTREAEERKRRSNDDHLVSKFMKRELTSFQNRN